MLNEEIIKRCANINIHTSWSIFFSLLFTHHTIPFIMSRFHTPIRIHGYDFSDYSTLNDYIQTKYPKEHAQYWNQHFREHSGFDFADS